MLIQPEISGCSIVLAGQFNPAIFHPAWFKDKNIEPNIQESETKIKVVHNDVSSFSIDTRNYFIQRDRFQLETTSAPWIIIADITREIFSDYLVHTPIRAFGVNLNMHFRLNSIDARNRLGRSLAPIDVWGDFGKEMDVESAELIGGVQSLTMTRKSREPSVRIDTNAKIEPSVKIDAQKGVFMSVNFHHDLENLPDTYGSEPAIQILTTRFEDELAEAETIIDNIMAVAHSQ